MTGHSSATLSCFHSAARVARPIKGCSSPPPALFYLRRRHPGQWIKNMKSEPEEEQFILFLEYFVDTLNRYIVIRISAIDVVLIHCDLGWPPWPWQLQLCDKGDLKVQYPAVTVTVGYSDIFANPRFISTTSMSDRGTQNWLHWKI